MSNMPKKPLIDPKKLEAYSLESQRPQPPVVGFVVREKTALPLRQQPISTMEWIGVRSMIFIALAICWTVVVCLMTIPAIIRTERMIDGVRIGTEQQAYNILGGLCLWAPVAVPLILFAIATLDAGRSRR